MGLNCLACLGRGASDNSNRPPTPLDHQGTSAAVDPRIPLNQRQIFLLGKNWKAISRKLECTGVCMFTRMFEHNPELIDVFPNLKHLKDTPQIEWPNDEPLQDHSLAVMSVFDEAVNSIQDADKFFEILKKQAQAHATKDGFNPSMFAEMKSPFLFSIQTTLEDRYTSQMETIYKVLDTLLFDTLIQEAQKIK